MTEFEMYLKRWRNSLGVPLPPAIARAAHLRVGQRVKVAVAEGRVVITAVEKTPPTLEERVANFDPQRHAGEAMVADPVGAEKR